MNEKEIEVKTNNDKINDKKDLSLSERERLIRKVTFFLRVYTPMLKCAYI